MAKRILLLLALVSCIGATPPTHILDVAVMGQSLASADIRYGETIPAAELEGSDVRRWYAGAWAKALAASGAASSPGIGQWQAKMARVTIEQGDASFVRFVEVVQNGASITLFVPAIGANPASANYLAWQADIAASGAQPRVLIWWQGANDYLMAPDVYYANLDAIWTAAKADAPSLERMLIVEAFDWVGGAAIHCGQDMWRVRMARGSFADQNADVETLDLSALPIGGDGCHLAWTENKLAGIALAAAIQL